MLRLTMGLLALGVTLGSAEAHAGSVGYECTVRLINPDCSTPEHPGMVNPYGLDDIPPGLWTTAEPVHFAVRCRMGCIAGGCEPACEGGSARWIVSMNNQPMLLSTGYYCPEGEVLTTDGPLQPGRYGLNWLDYSLGGSATGFHFEVSDTEPAPEPRTCAADADCPTCSTCSDGTCGLGVEQCDAPYPLAPDPLADFMADETDCSVTDAEGCAATRSSNGMTVVLLLGGVIALVRRKRHLMPKEQ